ncbi:peptide/nickel transport system substrate-binding protein [Paraburkholderia unamae]|uniref:ABC transporter substrate-binding protein n=1 Tax=Paraburkholderia unamae TaxID=219649 RepID=UPI000DC4E09C|nr:ABC transporter substrate-binding protein [Paraburkholderia unamae]RAR53327.1 peptide/nickel transport system substrate-binding protein [Paraburkholderia unamae]
MTVQARVRAIAAGAVAAASLFGAGEAPANTLTGAFDTGPAGAPQQFNPLTATAGYSWFNKYFGTLVLYNAEMTKIEGDLASDWNVSPDGKTITFHLRKGVKWQDGQPFTAKDVKFTLDLLKNPDLPNQFWARLADIQSVAVPDDNTVVLTLGKPNLALVDALTNVMIVPEHALASIPVKDLRTAAWWKTQPVGTGPFKWGKYVPDQYVELDANPGYYRGRPHIDALINRYFKDDGAAVLALQSGDIQYSYMSLAQVRNTKAERFRTIAGPSRVVNYVGVNFSDPRFKDLRVRQALLMAIDRAGLIKNLYAGQAQVANCVLTEPQYVPSNLKPYAYDPAAAKRLLDEAGWSKFAGQPIELLTYYTDPVSRNAMAVIQAMFAAVGVNVQPRFVDAPTYGELVRAGKFAMTFAGTTNGPDPDVLSSVLMSQYAPPRGYNLMRVNMPELDKLFDEGRAATDTAKRSSVYQDVCRYTNANLPWLPVLEANRFAGVSTQVQDFVWTPAPGGGRYMDHPERWSVK